MSDTDLKEKEEAAVDPAAFEGEFGKSFSDDEKDRINDLSDRVAGSSKTSGKKRFNLSRRGKGILGGIVGLAAAGGAAGFIIMAPILRLEGYMQQINQRVFQYASGAVEARAQHLLGRYMVGYVLDLERCGPTIHNGCRASYKKGIFAATYNQWKDKRIENKLLNNMGITIESERSPDPDTGRYRVTLKDSSGTPFDISEGDRRAGRFRGGEREFGREMRQFLRAETKWYEVMQRRGVRKYLERKHGINTYCFMACKTRDNIDQKFTNAKMKVRYKFTERFVYPFSAKYGLLLDCLATGGDGKRCDSESIRENDLQRNRISAEEADDIIRNVRDNPDLNLGNFVIKKLISKVFSEQVANKAIAAIPIAGQIYLAVTIADAATKVDKFIENNGFSQYAAAINSAQYLEYYTGMRSSADEIKSGVLPLDEVGALAQEFDGAEQSLVLDAASRDKLSSNSLFGTKAYAQAVDDYRCADGDPIPAGELVCEEKKVSRTFAIEKIRDNEILDTAVGVMNTYDRCLGLEIKGHCGGVKLSRDIGFLLRGINSVSGFLLGGLTNKLQSFVGGLPIIGDAINFIAGKAEELVGWLMGKVFPLPLKPDSPGRDKVDGLTAGGEFAAYEYAKGGTASDGSSYGLHGVALTPEQANAIEEDQAEQLAFERSQKSFIERNSDLSDQNSLIARSVMYAPTNFSGYMAHLTNFFGLFSFFSSPVTAASGSTPDSPFGIPRYGYALDDPTFAADPEQYDDAYCQVSKELREASKTEDPQTGFDEYAVSDPCALEREAADATGALFSDN